MFTKQNQNKFIYLLGYALAFVWVILGTSCEGLFKKKEERLPLARVGDAYLFKEDVLPLLSKGISKADSASFVANYINNWATDQLLLDKAKINLSQEKLREFDNLVDNYRIDLYTRAYKEALVAKGIDSLFSENDIQEVYEKEKDNFRLKERIARLRFIELPKTFLNKEEVIERLKRFEVGDKDYLDSIGVQFKKLNFNDSIWVRSSRIFKEIPPINYDNQERYLKKSQFFELEDSLGVYLVKIEEVKELNDIAPLSFVVPTIKQVLLNRRRLDYLRKLETEIKDEAIRDKEFEVFTNEK
jgi:hypothetical protein